MGHQVIYKSVQVSNIVHRYVVLPNLLHRKMPHVANIYRSLLVNELIHKTFYFCAERRQLYVMGIKIVYNLNAHTIVNFTQGWMYLLTYECVHTLPDGQ